MATVALFAAVHAVPVDTSDMCEMWASSGECDANPDYMRQNCAASCAGAKAKPGGGADRNATVARAFFICTTYVCK